MNAPVSVADQPLQPLIDWATRETRAAGLTVTGAQEMRRRDWTLLARIETNGGAVWAKASARAFAHEARCWRPWIGSFRDRCRNPCGAS